MENILKKISIKDLYIVASLLFSYINCYIIFFKKNLLNNLYNNENIFFTSFYTSLLFIIFLLIFWAIKVGINKIFNYIKI